MSLLTHPHLYEQLTDRGFFPDVVTVKVNAPASRTASGAEVPNWIDLTGHVDLAGAIGDLTVAERMTPEKSIAMADQKLLLAGYYPAILAEHEIQAGATRYRITNVQADSLEQVTLCYLERLAS